LAKVKLPSVRLIDDTIPRNATALTAPYRSR
jgi:hypothetical protein